MCMLIQCYALTVVMRLYERDVDSDLVECHNP